MNQNKITIDYLKKRKADQNKITMLTAYDYLTAEFEDNAGIDMILVGDSLGMVFLGYGTTKKVKIEDVVYHTKAVSRAVKKAMVVGDMPYLTYETPKDSLKNAKKLIEAGADNVKIEGDKPAIVAHLVKNNIQVMGHIGLTPQTITEFKLQGKDEESARRLINEAKSLEKAGCYSIVLECVPEHLAKKITNQIKIPTIGIGAGRHCDGQVLVIHDLLGIFDKFKPKFVKRYANLAPQMKNAISKYKDEVTKGEYPSDEYVYK